MTTKYRELLRERFGLPSAVAARYAGHIERYHPRRPRTLLEAIGLIDPTDRRGQSVHWRAGGGVMTQPMRFVHRDSQSALSYPDARSGRTGYGHPMPWRAGNKDRAMTQPRHAHAAEDPLLVADDDFKAATGESIERTLDLTTWQAGVDLESALPAT